MNDKKIIILDFSTSKVHIFPFDTFIYDDGEHFISKDDYQLGFTESNCQWMIVNELTIQIH